MSKKKNVQESVAIKWMETFIEEGTYPQLKQTEQKVKLLTSSMRNRLEQNENKRYEFTKYGLVGRFIAKRIYDTDVVGLNEYLYDLGLFLHVVEVDNKKIQENILYYDIIQEFRLPDTFYLKPSFNKAGKALTKLDGFEVNDTWSLEDMACALSIMKPELKQLNAAYEQLKKKILHTPEIQLLTTLPKEKRTPIKHKYGSLSVVANQPRYDVAKIYECFGEELLMEYGVPNINKLEAFILNGTITKKEVDQFKTLKDIRLDFTVMTLEDEQRLFQMLDQKQQTAAINRRINRRGA
ncbi:hypothetical protein [Caldifermentibacillus hisashii]|uniref:hypothetical protein n=1 Tax=Caldifermentibacillus hisashii TaxID=996558 RepID=UPI0022B95CF3|nr:hypothetical protein [Caldifermentibacillus hisashii]